MSQPSINGASLRCCTLIEPPMVFEDPNTKFGFNGVAIDYLEHLQRKLNFSCSSLERFKDGNGTGFNDFIYYLERCSTSDGLISEDPNCTCDIGAAGFGRNSKRLGRVDFLPSFLNDDIRVITHIDNTAEPMGGAFFLTSFSLHVWLAIVSLMVIFVLLKLLDTSFAPDLQHDAPRLPANASWQLRATHFLLKNSILFRVRKAVESITHRMIGQPTGNVQGDNCTFRQRLLNIVILICGLFLILAYEATMTASLVQETTISEFRSVHDFKTCKILPTDVCIPRGGTIEAFWNHSIASTRCNKESGLNPNTVGSLSELLEKTATKECKYSLSIGSVLMDATQGRYCGVLVLTGGHFLEGGCGFTLPRNSPYSMDVTNATLQLRAEGALPTRHEYLQRSGQCHSLLGTKLTFGRLRLFFFVTYGVCFLIFLGIIFVPRKTARQIDQGKSDVEAVTSSDEQDSA